MLSLSLINCVWTDSKTCWQENVGDGVCVPGTCLETSELMHRVYRESHRTASMCLPVGSRRGTFSLSDTVLVRCLNDTCRIPMIHHDNMKS